MHLQQQMAMQQGAAAAMQQSVLATMTNQHAPTPTTNNRSNNNHGGGWKQQERNNMQTMPTYPPAFGTTFAPMGNNSSNNQGKEKNLFCIFDNQNYCFTHGHHVKDNHTSQMCSMPGPNHNPNATKFNAMGGSNKRERIRPLCPPSTAASQVVTARRLPARVILPGAPRGFLADAAAGAEEGNKQTRWVCPCPCP